MNPLHLQVCQVQIQPNTEATEKKSIYIEPVEFLFINIPPTIQNNNYLHGIYIVLGIVIIQRLFEIYRRMYTGHMQMLCHSF